MGAHPEALMQTQSMRIRATWTSPCQ